MPPDRTSSGAMRKLLVIVPALAVACSNAASEPLSPPPQTPVATTATSTTTTTTTPRPSTTTTSSTTTTTPVGPNAVVVFMPDGLVEGFEDLVRSIDGVGTVALMHTATLHLTATHDAAGSLVDQPPSGFVIPVQGISLDPAAYGAFVSPETAAALAALGPEEAILSTGSTQIRRIGVGGALTFEDGTVLTVAHVIDDGAIASTELFTIDQDLMKSGNAITRSAFLDYDGDPAVLEQQLRTLLPPDTLLRVRYRAPGEGERPRAVRSQVFMKQTFGEFAYRPTSGGSFRIDPAWTAENIVFADLPLLGPTWCHRAFVELLAGVMQSLVDDGLEDVIDRSAFRGCWNPRYIAGGTRLSRHAWGVAADINFGNPTDGGPGSPVHPELLARMLALGATSGADWANPDPGHFEFYGFDWLDGTATRSLFEDEGADAE